MLIARIIRLLVSALFLVTSASGHTRITHSLTTHIYKSSDVDWAVEYTSQKPIQSIAFVRSPDNSRTTRWLSPQGEFEIIYQDNREIAQRKDGKPFTLARFNLTPTYTHLPKDYAPFSPLSDGGMIIHSGRFFACIHECSDEVQGWRLSLTTLSDEHILLNGKVIQETASWMDQQPGKSIYIGTQKPAESTGTLSVIDQGLPFKIRESLEESIPRLMVYFEEKLGKLSSKEKPSLFASYSNKSGTSRQGGVLPNQMFMHWDMNNLDEHLDDDQFINTIIKFFAHEAAHLFQSTSAFANTNDAWIHEGSADYFALDAFVKLYPNMIDYVRSVGEDSQRSCTENLDLYSLASASESGAFEMHYHCGLLLHQRIEKELENQLGSHSLYSVWREYRQRISTNDKDHRELYLDVVEEFVDKGFRQKIEFFIDNEHLDPNAAVQSLLE